MAARCPTAVAVHDDCDVHCEVLYITERMSKKMSGPARGLDHGFDVIEISIQGASAERSEPVDGFGTAIFEGFRASQILRLLEFAGMRAQIAVADIEQRFEFGERQLLTHRQRAHDAETHTLVDQTIELAVVSLGAHAWHRG